MADLCKTLQPAFSRYSWTLFLSMLVGLLAVAKEKTLSSLAQAHIRPLALPQSLPLARALAPHLPATARHPADPQALPAKSAGDAR